ncbi:MAG TPA: rRNA methyltransferase, partial [Kandleria vitulina]|nr:rRNA methyltransferase [Kandleria vitulina]
MLSMVEYVHERMSTYKKREIGADFTMGKGNDTVFLSELCDQVYSFDIQDEALETT